MHKSVLVALDAGGEIVKTRFDASNAHNKFDREFAAKGVQEDVPELLPWAQATLSIDATHAQPGADGTKIQLWKPVAVIKVTP